MANPATARAPVVGDGSAYRIGLRAFGDTIGANGADYIERLKIGPLG